LIGLIGLIELCFSIFYTRYLHNVCISLGSECIRIYVLGYIVLLFMYCHDS